MRKTVILLMVLTVASIAPSSLAVEVHSYVQLFDVSGSISTTELARSQAGASIYVTLSSPGSTGLIKQFSNWETIPTIKAGPTTDKPTLQAGIAAVGPTTGMTALYQAMIDACDELGDLPYPRVLVVYTDGGENDSQAPHDTEAAVAAAVVANDVIPYVIYNTDGGAPGINGDGLSNPAATIAALEGEGVIVFPAASQQDVDDAIDWIINRPIAVPSLAPLGMVVLAALLIASMIFLLARRRGASLA